MTLEPIDYEMMARALNLATKGIYTSTPNPSVGCVITQNVTPSQLVEIMLRLRL